MICRDLRLVFVSLCELRRIFECLVEGDAQRRRDHLCDPVHFRVRHVHRAADVFDRRLCRHGPERDDLRHISRARISRVTYLITSPRRFMQKSMSMSGMLDALGIQEALEQQLYCSGSTSVIPCIRHQAIRLPIHVPDPLGCPAPSRSG